MTVNSRCLSKRFMSWRTSRAWCGPSHWETALYGCSDSMTALALLPTPSIFRLNRAGLLEVVGLALRIGNSALSENLTKQPLLRNFLHPLNREELDVGHRHPLGLQQQIPQVLIAPAAVNQHTNVPVHPFHHSEAYLRAAVVHYTFEVFEQHEGTLRSGESGEREHSYVD